LSIKFQTSLQNENLIFVLQYQSPSELITKTQDNVKNQQKQQDKIKTHIGTA
jgi:hypothetical protein